MSDFYSIDSTIFENHEFKMMTELQQSIWFFSVTSTYARHSAGFGIYPVSTASFLHLKCQSVENELGTKLKKNFPLDPALVQDQLGRDDLEMSLFSGKSKIGQMVRDFPDWIDYCPENDVIFSKKFFKYSGHIYLRNSKALIQALHKEYEINKHRTHEKWWGELMNIYEERIKKDWQEYFFENVKENRKSPIQKTFEILFELKEKYKTKNVFEPKSAKKLIEKHEKIIC
jgi:hypothetical protein